MRLASLKDLYVDELKDLYDAEHQLLKALPKVIQACTSTSLRNALEAHRGQTEEHVRRLEQILEDLGEMGSKPSARNVKCRGMKGLLEEGGQRITQEAGPSVRDAALIAVAQKVEHYEMAGYGCVRTYAEILGYDTAARLLQQTLEEEEAADKKLTEVAESMINVDAAEEEAA